MKHMRVFWKRHGWETRLETMSNIAVASVGRTGINQFHKEPYFISHLSNQIGYNVRFATLRAAQAWVERKLKVKE